MRSAVALSLVCGLLAAMSGAAVADDLWPAKPIRVILPVAPGTGADVVTRLVLNQIAIQIGQQIVVENRGGAGGTIGTAAAAKADPDGYTLLAQSTSHTIAPAIYTKLPYDVTKDFSAVAAFGRMPTALIMAPSKGFKTVQDFVAAAKTAPSKFTYASAGVGSTTHLTAERFRLSAGFEAIHVPFRGGGFRPEVSSGRVDFAFSPIAVAVPDIRDGRLMALAVSGLQRSSALPDVPTTREAGYPNSDYALWVGLFAPVKTPRPIVERLHSETVKALQDPGLRQRLVALDVEPMPYSPEQFDTFIKDEIPVQTELARAAGLQPN